MNQKPLKTGWLKPLYLFIYGANIVIFSFFFIGFIPFIIERYMAMAPEGRAGAVLVLGLIGFAIILSAVIGPIMLLWKVTPPLRFYEDGFVKGSQEKILYKDLVYFYVYGQGGYDYALRGVQFMYYKDARGKWKRFPWMQYSKSAFKSFQDFYMEAALPQAINRIENGESLNFSFLDPFKRTPFTTKKLLNHYEKKALILTVNKEGVALDDEFYPFKRYQAFFMNNGKITNGALNIQSKKGEVIAVLNDKAFLQNSNLVNGLLSYLQD